MKSNWFRVGFMFDDDDEVAHAYCRLIAAARLVMPVLSRSQLHSFMYGLDCNRLKLVVVSSVQAVSYIDWLRSRYPSVPVVWFETEHTPSSDVLYDLFDRVDRPYDWGWGVDLDVYARQARKRKLTERPRFLFLERDEQLRTALADRGYAAENFSGHYFAADIAIQPKKTLVPNRIYEAAASAMPALSVSANCEWLKAVGGYPVFLDTDGLDKCLRFVEETDYYVMGKVARLKVPSKGDLFISLRSRLRRSLPHFDKRNSILYNIHQTLKGGDKNGWVA